MKVIRANCRLQFTSKDVDFIVSVLGGEVHRNKILVDLLTDEHSRDAILDDEALFQALLEQTTWLKVSSRFLFYVIVRQVLLRAGIDDRDMADYVAELLAEFSLTERTQCVVPGRESPLEYCVDMLEALQSADERTRFLLHAHIGNHTLFFSGVFPKRLRSRAERRGFPDLQYYEELGRMNYRVASDHRLAQKYELAPIYATLSENFQATRKALNDMAERLLFLDDAPPPSEN